MHVIFHSYRSIFFHFTMVEIFLAKITLLFYIAKLFPRFFQLNIFPMVINSWKNLRISTICITFAPEVRADLCGYRLKVRADLCWFYIKVRPNLCNL